MNKEDLFSKLKCFQSDIDDIKLLKDNKEGERLQWCRTNKKYIKDILPKKGKLYKITTLVNSGINSYDLGNFEMDESYFFRATDLRLDFRNLLDRYSGRLKIKGEVLNMNGVKMDLYNPEIYLDCLEDVNNSIVGSDKITKIYVMIDKNTGYYKIGRSNNPKRREKTLQSEKPTIEMLFSFDAKSSHEKTLHNMFNEKRIRGEWFDLNGSDILLIKNSTFNTISI